MRVNIKKINDNAIIPTAGTKYSAGFDLYACIENDFKIAPGETKKVGTGLALEIPIGYFGGVFARSGLATKQGLRPANCTGVIDSDYRGELIVALRNESSNVQTIHNGDRIAQLILMPYLYTEFREVEDLDVTDRGSGGFGSTGVK